MTGVVGKNLGIHSSGSTGPRLRVVMGGEEREGGEYPTFLLSRDQNQLNPSVHISRGSKPFLILDLSSRYTRNTEPVLALLQVATGTGQDG